VTAHNAKHAIMLSPVRLSARLSSYFLAIGVDISKTVAYAIRAKYY